MDTQEQFKQISATSKQKNSSTRTLPKHQQMYPNY